jgi:hypothetical protein
VWQAILSALLLRKNQKQTGLSAPRSTEGLEREIDEQVYALYGLTPEEISIVEAANK